MYPDSCVQGCGQVWVSCWDDQDFGVSNVPGFDCRPEVLGYCTCIVHTPRLSREFYLYRGRGRSEVKKNFFVHLKSPINYGPPLIIFISFLGKN